MTDLQKDLELVRQNKGKRIKGNKPKNRVVNQYTMIASIFLLLSGFVCEQYFPEIAKRMRSYARPQIFSERTRATVVPISPPVHLNKLTKEQIYAIRLKEVSKTPSLLVRPYQPNKEVFNTLVDGRSWWGLRGRYLYGLWYGTKRATEGASLEGIGIANPFLLVFPHFEAMLPLIPAPEIADTDLEPQPENIIISANGRMSQTTYDISGFISKLRQHRWIINRETLTARKAYTTEKDLAIYVAMYNAFAKLADPDDPVRLVCRSIDLNEYNAHDLGFRYAKVILDDNAEPDPKGLPPVHANEFHRIQQVLQPGTSAGGPCNSKDWGLGEFTIKQLPCRVKILLWRFQPIDIDPPEFTYVINFR